MVYIGKEVKASIFVSPEAVKRHKLILLLVQSMACQKWDPNLRNFEKAEIAGVNPNKFLKSLAPDQDPDQDISIDLKMCYGVVVLCVSVYV